MKSILIVDDQFGIRALLSEVLQKEGYKVFQAENGIDALKIITEQSPNLIFLDFKIPGMDGMEILQRLKQMENNIPVIMMTAYNDEKTVQKSLALGASLHIAKPFDINKIRQIVSELI